MIKETGHTDNMARMSGMWEQETAAFKVVEIFVILTEASLHH